MAPMLRPIMLLRRDVMASAAAWGDSSARKFK